MEWSTAQTELPLLVGDLLGIPCDWRDQPLPFIAGPRATLDLLGASVVGVDDVRWEDTTDGVLATAHGQRELTLQVSVWHHRQPLAVSARAYLERLRTRLRLPSALAALSVLGFAHVRTEAMVDVDPIEDGRVNSVSTMDLRLGYSVTEADSEIPFIEAAHISSTLSDAGGNVLGDSLQIDINPEAL